MNHPNAIPPNDVTPPAHADVTEPSTFPGSRSDLLIIQGLRRIIRAVDIHSRKLSTTFGVTGPQLVCLMTLRDEGPLSQKALGQKVHVGGSTITGIIDRLEEKKLVQRLRDTGDRRRSIVRITKQGDELIASAPSPLQETFSRRLDGLPELEKAAISMSIQRIVDLMEANEIDAAPILSTDRHIDDEP